jgi:quercetin dioxygenase-like cupin family protein
MLIVKRTSSALFVLIVAALGVAAHAQDNKPATAAEPKRSILGRLDQSGVDGKEIVLGTVELPQGVTIGWHSHPGDEAGYILRGSIVWKVRGQPDRELKAGDHFFNPRGSVHSVTSLEPAAVVSTWIVDKGKPMSEPAK